MSHWAENSLKPSGQSFSHGQGSAHVTNIICYDFTLCLWFTNENRRAEVNKCRRGARSLLVHSFNGKEIWKERKIRRHSQQIQRFLIFVSHKQDEKAPLPYLEMNSGTGFNGKSWGYSPYNTSWWPIGLWWSKSLQKGNICQEIYVAATTNYTPLRVHPSENTSKIQRGRHHIPGPSRSAHRHSFLVMSLTRTDCKMHQDQHHH